jgi:hypothetical protein
LLSKQARPEVEHYIRWMKETEFQLVPSVPCRLSRDAVEEQLYEAERSAIRSRYPTIAEKIVESYRQLDAHPELCEELKVPEVDLFWVHLTPTGDGSTCRSEGCNEPTVRSSVFCARHHYERIIGKPAPQDH